jgi:hypothetical protein
VNWWKPAIALAVVGLALYWGWSWGRSDRDGRIGALKDSLSVIEDRADSLAEVKVQVDTVAAKDSVRTVIIVREIEREVDEAIADARSPQDSLRKALPGRLQPVFDRMLGSYESALTGKDSIIAEERESLEFARDRIRVRDLEIVTLREGWDRERELRKEIEKPDINLFGLGLEFTCGPQVGLGLVTPGQAGAYVGVGCTVGK